VIDSKITAQAILRRDFALARTFAIPSASHTLFKLEILDDGEMRHPRLKHRRMAKTTSL